MTGNILWLLDAKAPLLVAAFITIWDFLDT